MKSFKSLWAALIILSVSLAVIPFMGAGTNDSEATESRPLENIQDANTTTVLGYPFVTNQYADALTKTETKLLGTTTTDVLAALSQDVSFIDTFQRGSTIFSVITVSQDAGNNGGHRSAVLFTRSEDYGASWTDYVTIDSLVVPLNAAAATADATTFDIVANARIAGAGDTIYVAFLCNTMQIGGTGDRGGPLGHVSLDNANINEGNSPANGDHTITDPSTARINTLSNNLHVFITASTDDGASFQIPRMVPTAYDRFMGGFYPAGGGNGYNNAQQVGQPARTASLTYDSALPGSLQLLALGDGTTIDRVYLAWLDNTNGDASLNTGIPDPIIYAPKPVFAALTFDNVAADAGASSALNYLASSIAYHGTFSGDEDGFGHVAQTGPSGATVTWDKIKLLGVAGPGFYTSDDPDGTVSGDKVWLIGHNTEPENAPVDSGRVYVATLDRIAPFAGRGGGLGGFFPRFGSFTTVDHAGARNSTANLNNAEEFDFDATVDGDINNAQLYVFLTSNFPLDDVVLELDGSADANGDTNTAANSMYIVNFLDPTNQFGFNSIASQVSYDRSMATLGVVTYSNPKVAVIGDGGSSAATVSDDFVVMAFEAKGITRDEIAGWTTPTSSIDTLASINEHGYLTIDNVYLIANFNSGATTGLGQGAIGFNAERPSRIDGCVDGTIYNEDTPTTTSTTATRDSVSTDATLVDLQLHVLTGLVEQRTFIGVNFTSFTPGTAKAIATTDRVVSPPVITTGLNNADLYVGNVNLTEIEKTSSQYPFESVRVTTRGTTSDGVAFHNRTPVSTDFAIQTRNVQVLNENFVEMNIIYLTPAKIIADVNGNGSLVAFGTGGSNDRNYDAFSKILQFVNLLNPLNDNSDGGVCLIGRQDRDRRWRR